MTTTCRASVAGFAAAIFLGAAPVGAQLAETHALELLPVQGNVFALFGPGGNVTLQVGAEGVVLVDTLTTEVSDEVLEIVGSLSPRPIRHIVLTSGDVDHAGGAEVLSAAGTYIRMLDALDPRGMDTNASIIAHVNVLSRMSGPSEGDPGMPSGAWPTDTYFTREWPLFVNGEAMQLFYIPNAHTDGDTIVFFRRSDVVSTGDIYNTTGFPIFDVDRGGSIEGVIEALNLVLDLTIPGPNEDGGTVVVPGHGRLSDQTDVANYRDMVTIVRDRVRALVDEGLSLEEVRARRPTLDYDGLYEESPGTWTGERFVEEVYRDLRGSEP